MLRNNCLLLGVSCPVSGGGLEPDDRSSELAPNSASAYHREVRATRFEFEYRFWIILAIFVAGFSLSWVDHVSFIAAFRRLFAPSIASATHEAAGFSRMVILAGALLVFAAAALRTWAAAYLRTAIVHDTEQHAEALVADGPFRFVRNPLYLANLPMAAGIGVLASRSGFFFLVVANWLFVYRLIIREEEVLKRTQGESYRAYLQAVPRFRPSLTPRVPPGNRAPSWGQAFTGEMFVWLFGAAELCLAITLNAKLGEIVFVVGFAAYFLFSQLLRKQKTG